MGTSEYFVLGIIPADELTRSLGSLLTDSRESASDGAAGTPDQAAPEGDSALARYTIDLTQRARERKIDPIFGRHREIRQILDILARRRKNNPIVVGEAARPTAGASSRTSCC